MKLSVLFVGKTEAAFSSLVSDYLARIQRYLPVEVRVVPEPKNAKSLPARALCEREGEALLKFFGQQADVYLLDEKGSQFDSKGLATWMEKKMVSGTKELILVIGGPYGFSEAVRAKAAGSIALSRLTFSHQMVRVILLEQVYRAFTIINGEPYHHD